MDSAAIIRPRVASDQLTFKPSPDPSRIPEVSSQQECKPLTIFIELVNLPVSFSGLLLFCLTVFAGILRPRQRTISAWHAEEQANYWLTLGQSSRRSPSVMVVIPSPLTTMGERLFHTELCATPPIVSSQSISPFEKQPSRRCQHHQIVHQGYSHALEPSVTLHS